MVNIICVSLLLDYQHTTIIDYELDKSHMSIEDNLVDPNVESSEHDYSYVEDITLTRCIQCFSIGWFLLGGIYGTA